MKKVKFENGKFGIRRYWFFGWHFQDLTWLSFQWTRSSRHFKDCMGSEKDVDSVLLDFKSNKFKYKVVD